MFEFVAAAVSGAHPPIPVGQLAILVATFCLAIALLCIKRIVAPIGPLVRALVAAATLVLAVGIALVLLIAVMTHGLLT